VDAVYAPEMSVATYQTERGHLLQFEQGHSGVRWDADISRSVCAMGAGACAPVM
jgi:hypothetical protein